MTKQILAFLFCLIPATVWASQERFRKPLCGRGVEGGRRGLIFDKLLCDILNRVIHRGRI